MAANTKVVEAETVTPKEFVPFADDIQSWGPFRDLQLVTTQYGTYNVPRGQIMTFEMQIVWDKKEGREVEQMMPQYETVENLDNSDQRPSVPLKGKTDEENTANVLAYSQMQRAAKAQAQADRKKKEK